MAAAASSEGAKRLRIGKYEVQSHIATGGMGAVYKAVDIDLKRDVALKVMNPELAANPGMMERFRREARAAAKLHHENIISVFEFGEDRGTFFIAMEYVEGVDLHTYVHKKGKLRAEKACEILRQALLALQHAHQQGVIHRDVKPSNFLIVRKSGKLLVKLGDMGLARQQKDEDFRLTRAGTTVGTIDYMAPEQAKDSDTADGRSDIYSLGCTLFHMLTGHAPFPEGSLVERMYKHLEAPPPDIRELNADVPPGLAFILKRMLAKDPKERYQQPEEVLSDLKRMDTLGLPPVPQEEILSGLLEDKGAAASQLTSRVSAGAQARASRPPDLAAPPKKGKAPEAPADAGTKKRPALTTKPLAGPQIAPDSDSELDDAGAAASRADTLDRDSDAEDAEHDEAPPPRLLPAEEPEPRKSRVLTFVVIGALGVLIIVGGIFALNLSTNPGGTAKTSGSSSGPSRKGISSSTSQDGSSSDLSSSHPGGIALISRKVPDVDVASLKKEIEKPWTDAAPLPAPSGTISVSRKFTEETDKQVRSLSAAAGLVARRGTWVIEIADNGPLYEPSLLLEECNLILRAAKGYRPMIVWDFSRNRELPAAWLTLRQGSLIVEGLDIVFRCPTTGPVEPAALLMLADADVAATGCTFSVVGSTKDNMSAVRFEGKADDHRCRLTNCLVRGSQLSALHVQAPAADVLVENSLLVGGNRPLVQIEAGPSPATTVRLVKSTLCGTESLLQIRPAGAEDAPAVQLVCWDALLARSHTQPGGALVRISDGKSSSALQWRAINCLYAGWNELLKARETIHASDWPAWVQRFQTGDFDKAIGERWPGDFTGELGIRACTDFAVVANMPVAYQATAPAKATPGVIGCPMASLPVARDAWLQMTYDRENAPVAQRFSGSPAPQVPDAEEGYYSGGVFDPATAKEKDLGAYLQTIQKTSRLTNRVVIRLTGAGEWPTSPIRVRGVNLVLYFDPGDGKETRPLALVPQGKYTAQDSLIEVQDGNLDIIGGEFRVPSRKDGYPVHIARVTNGDLRLHGCKLYGPLPQRIDPHRSLVRAEHDGDKTTHDCVLDECVFVTSGTVVELAGAGMHMRMQECLAAAGQELLNLDFSGLKNPRIRTTCLLEQNTLAARNALVRVHDSGNPGVPLEPALVLSRGNVFWAPYVESTPGKPPHSGVLLCSQDTMAHAVILWHGDGNVYDKRMHYLFAAPDAIPQHPQPAAFWPLLWSCPNDMFLIYEGKPPPQVDLTNPRSVENLYFPPEASARTPPPGADLVKLGVRKPRGSP